MGMFQPHNYGTDFLQGMTAVSGMFNDERRMKLEERKQAQDEQRQAQDATTRSLQQDELRLKNKKSEADLLREQKLGEFLDSAKRLETGQMQDKDYARLAGVTEDLIKDTPYITDDILQNPTGYKQKVSDLAKGVAAIRTLPVGNYKYSRDDNMPEINNMLDSYGSLLSKDRLGKTFTDKDGSITGKAGGKYKTMAADGFMMASGEGTNAGFVPLFSVSDESGNPIIGADGRRMLVPATIGTTNGADDKLRVISPEELFTKAGYAMKVANVVETLGLNDPVKRQQYVAQGAMQYLPADEQAKMLIAQAKPREKKFHAYNKNQNVYDENGSLVQAAQDEEKVAKAPTTRTIKRNGYEVAEEWNGEKWAEVGRNKIKETGGGSSGKGSRDDTGGQAKVGVLNAVKSAMVRRYIPVAQSEMKRTGRSTDDISPTAEDKALGLSANPAGIYSALGATGKQVYDRAMLLAEQYASNGQNPETAVSNGIEQSRKEYGLDSGGMVKGPKQTAQPKAQPRQQTQPRQQVAKRDTRPPLSSFNKGK